MNLIKNNTGRLCIHIRRLLVLALGGLCFTAPCSGAAEFPPEILTLKAEFENPPMSSRPMTWWHWMNGNITQEGITKDLEWMKKFGLGGAVVFNIGYFPDTTPRKVPFNSEAWWGMVDHALGEADRIGLKLGFHNCDGWSHSGGPWITPEMSMKELTWTETFVTAGEQKIKLKQPETALDFYRDIAVLAWPVKETADTVICSQLRSNLKKFQPKILQDGNKKTCLNVEVGPEQEPVWFDFAFDQPQTVSAVTIGTHNHRLTLLDMRIEASDDGVTYRAVKTWSTRSDGQVGLGWKNLAQVGHFTFSFEATQARNFRISVDESSPFRLSDIRLHEKPRIDFYEAKAGHTQYTEHGGAPEFYQADRSLYAQDFKDSIVPRESILELSDKLDANGRLDWSPEKGHWRVLRVGYTTNGRTVNPSSVEGRGLEVDKLSPSTMELHYNSFMKKTLERPLNRKNKTIGFTQVESWEPGPQNWTEDLPNIFTTYNGYDLKQFLPVLTGGHIVDSYEVSERFLWDFRKTLATGFKENCFDKIAELARKDGLMALGENAGRQQYLYDPINYQSAAGIPQGEFWMDKNKIPRQDCKAASSVAHIYGGQLAAAEAFTAGGAWGFGPSDLKILGDRAFAMGVNFYVLHASVHQPYSHLKPGFSLAKAGTHFHRNNIVFDASSAWGNYITRAQHLLRKGRFVADVLAFTGESIPNYLGWRHELSVPLPKGYDYDGCNADIILNHARVENGRIVLDSGMSYRVLLLPDSDSMSLPLLTKIAELVKAGATVVGSSPQAAHGLKQYPAQGASVRKIAKAVWGNWDGKEQGQNQYGKGRVIWGTSFPEIFKEMALVPDFDFTKGKPGAEINYLHRRTDTADLYFVANAKDRVETIHAKFRVQGKTPYLFKAETGEVEALAGYRVAGEYIEIPLQLDPAESLFVVFMPGPKREIITEVTGSSQPQIVYQDHQPLVEFEESGEYRLTTAQGKTHRKSVSLPKPLTLDGPWDIVFQVGKQAQEKKIQRELFEWNKAEDPDIRYYSGTAVYQKTFKLPSDYLDSAQKLYLDLGEVQKIAKVKINGNPCPDLWKPPYRADITRHVKAGRNEIEVAVTSTWVNRMIGDEELPEDLTYGSKKFIELPEWMDGSIPRPSDRQTFTIVKFYKKGHPLSPSGLIGPVMLKATKTVPVK